MLGLLRSGGPIDPCNDPFGDVFGIPCDDPSIDPRFWYSGDPESNYGWLNIIPTDQRMAVHTGPFFLEVDKPITIIVGYTIGQGDSPLNSVTVGKEVSAFVQQFYQSNFDDNILPVEEENSLIVDEFKLFQNYPNPFNPATNIGFRIADFGFVSFKVYDVLGSEVATLVNDEKPAGSYEVKFSATGLPSGIYFYKLQTESFIETKKMILLK
ncbi:MAG: T9SS type A sorting domain-containing protein [Bacteroidetes bacterium]|nr:T9SS type A sorting domain-containing protein [Bacteroidota bacterium]